MNRPRAAVTGLGIIASIGQDGPAFWKSLLDGVCGIGAITLFDASGYRAKKAAEVRGFDPRRYFSPRQLERMSRCDQLGMKAVGEALSDSGLAYEDLIDHHFSWGVQVLVGEEKYGARTCYVIRSQPGPGEPSTYSTVTSWIDQTIYVPVRVEKVIRESGVKKQFVYYGLQQSRGVWGARQVEVRVEGSPAQTYLIISRGSGKANLGPRDFDPIVLMKSTQP